MLGAAIRMHEAGYELYDPVVYSPRIARIRDHIAFDTSKVQVTEHTVRDADG